MLPQSFVEGCLTLVECLSFADHSRDMPGMVQREAMIGQRQRNGRKCGLTFIRQPSGPIPIRAETAEIRAGDLVSIYGDGRGGKDVPMVVRSPDPGQGAVMPQSGPRS